MPCEACNVQFTVFRRKRCCFACKRFYCNNCLSASSPAGSPVGPLCARCSVFAKRPLLRVDLQQLKPKDLIFYLQSKHISTAGCVEKDELVGLVLNHVQQSDQTPAATGTSNHEGAPRDFESAHSFEALKQSCQNFFSNLSEKVNESFSFESKPAEQESQNNRRSSSASNQLGDHISEQPRVSTRKIPTYASSQHMAAAEKKGDRPVDNDSLDNRNIVLPPREQPATDVDSSSTSTQTCSPLASLKSKTSSQSSPDDAQQRDSQSLCTPPETLSHLRIEDRTANGFVSGCDCSDDEIITVFRTRNGCRLQSSQSTFPMENPVAGTSGSNTALHTASTATAAKLYPSLKVENYDDSSASSFEELGAIGGTSDDSKTGPDHSAQSSEPWQLVDREAMTDDVGEGELGKDVKGGLESSTATVMYTEKNPNVQSHRSVPKTTRTKKVTRRRSDGFLNRRRRRASDDESPTSPDSYTPVIPNIKDARTIFEVNETHNERDVESDVQGVNDGRRVEGARRFHCKRCGKNHLNIKKQVEKMRHDLENSHMTEADIKRELDEFLVYLEERTRSVDCSDSETTAASSVSGTRDTSSHILPPLNSPTQSFDENEGIHVYAAPSEFSAATTDSRFINLEDFGSLEELEQLCVKQLKEILMLNRVDYKGCCEKQELFERVVRLWKNLKSTPAIDKLQTDELCKICMDAPIECVILECGHMATCTGCGKVLSECPICRQYIVRVVRIFKA